ncbi:ribosomal protein S18 acetylase RimI-like enzyme [Alkalihalobacillus xiaoxiensis]|uniref:Ribosomal protein S18 acetylase RimI-like enzyme n=1 Tax=Shouchella xiaoxiensis TaxID=766895 RepID=A0ABS2SMP9_9BACI|nr:ribosomal protein S18 acetylase RimI-like enzyme [Shouchella xiaoxiensis]
MSGSIQIIKASPSSIIGGQLNAMALGTMAHTIVGSTNQTVIEETMGALWQQKNNRFSHEFAYEAKQGKKTLGILTCYPTPVLDSLGLPTAKQILSIRRMEMIVYAVKNIRSIYGIMTMEEGKKDEFHIGSIAMLPESRGLGIGKLLLAKAEELAKEQSCTKISLTVREDNPKARQLYERVGYQVAGKIKKGSFSLDRMVKQL